MAELMRESVGLLRIAGGSGNDCSVAIRHKLMLTLVSAMLGALLSGCTANKSPSQGEPAWPMLLKMLPFHWRQA